MVNVRLMESWKVSKFVFKLCNLWLSCFLWSSVPSCWAELLGVCWGFKGMPLPLFSILIWLVIILSFPHKKGRKKKNLATVLSIVCYSMQYWMPFEKYTAQRFLQKIKLASIPAIYAYQREQRGVILGSQQCLAVVASVTSSIT